MGAKRVTSKDVAEKAGVSRTTVSFVLNNVPGMQITEETRTWVLKAANDLGYVPDAAAQALASRRSHIVGLVIIRNPYQVATDAFLIEMLNGLVGAARDHGLRLLVDIVEHEHQAQTYMHLVRAKRIDGLILAGPRFDDLALQKLTEQNFPTVLIGELQGAPFASVDVNNCAASHQAVAHLLSLGHTRIGCITNALRSYGAAQLRLEGYREALTAVGLPYDESLVRYGDFDPDNGYRQMKSLLAVKPAITAAFVASDVVAIGALAAIHEQGLRIPEDIAVVGYDDVPFAKFMNPPLTTIRLPSVKLGYMAIEQLVKLIRQEPLEKMNLRLGTELVIRSSCGAVHA